MYLSIGICIHQFFPKFPSNFFDVVVTPGGRGRGFGVFFIGPLIGKYFLVITLVMIHTITLVVWILWSSVDLCFFFPLPMSIMGV